MRSSIASEAIPEGISQIVPEVDPEPEILELVPTFLNSRMRDVAQMESYIASGSWKELAILGHTLKGISKPYGFPTLGILGAELEEQAKLQSQEKALEILSKIKSYLRI